MANTLSKAGYPKEVSVLEASDMCRENYYWKGKCCLTGWINTNFPPEPDFDPKDNWDSYPQKTIANIKAREVMEKLIIKIHPEEFSWGFEGIEDFSDRTSRKLGLSLGYLAKLYNTMLYKLGYDIKKEDRLKDK